MSGFFFFFEGCIILQPLLTFERVDIMVRVLKLLRINILKLASCLSGDIEIAIILVWSSSSGYIQIV